MCPSHLCHKSEKNHNQPYSSHALLSSPATCRDYNINSLRPRSVNLYSASSHIQVYVCYFADQVFGEHHMHYFRSESSLCLSFSFGIFSSLFLLISLFSIFWTQLSFHFDYSWNIISCIEIYMSYCSDI